jgi:ElaB/YqjD/DUF883 family membrane-anchored ribosome-binding protein
MENRRTTRYDTASINKRITHMSYPMNEFITDLKKPAQVADEWISSTADTAKSASHKAARGISSLLDRGKDISESIRKGVGKEADVVNAVLHRNPYPTVLAAIGAGALFGALIAWRLNCTSK